MSESEIRTCSWILLYSPLKQNSAVGLFLDCTLQEQRLALLTGGNAIPEVTFDFMLDHITSSQIQVSTLSAERTMQNLREFYLMLVGKHSSLSLAFFGQELRRQRTGGFFFFEHGNYIPENHCIDRVSHLRVLLHWFQVPLLTLLLYLYPNQTSGVAQMVVVKSTAIIRFIFLNAAILLGKKATITGSILHM